MQEKKPFIYLFTSPNGYYIFDVNKNTIINCKEETYRFLQSVLNGENRSVDIDRSKIDEIAVLKDAGYLSTNRIKIIEHPDTIHLKRILESRIEQLVLQITQSCNLTCSYCPYANKTNGILQRNHSNQHMSWDVARKSVDFYYEHSYECNQAIFAMVNFS